VDCLEYCWATWPPSRANYQQRGGRAGRRADGSSLVCTYAQSRSFDQAVFNQFSDFYGKPLRKPIVRLGRERFGRRHAHSFLLGEFFRRIYPVGTIVTTLQAYNHMGWLCAEPKVLRQVPDQARAEKLLPSPHTPLNESQAWWVPGDPPYRQFDHFLAYLLGSGEPLKDELKALLTGTPLVYRRGCYCGSS